MSSNRRFAEADRYRGTDSIVFATFDGALHPWLAKKPASVELSICQCNGGKSQEMSIGRVSTPNSKDGIVCALSPLGVKTLSCQTIRLAVSWQTHPRRFAVYTSSPLADLERCGCLGAGQCVNHCR